MSIIEKALDELERSSPKPANEPKVVTDLHKDNGKEPQASAEDNASIRTAKARELDFERLSKAGILVPNTTDRMLCEQYRRLKRPLLVNAFGSSGQAIGNHNLLMVGSAVEGEGKSFTALNLAMSVTSEVNHTVLLIDADTTKRGLSRLLGVEDDPGLTDYLADASTNLADFLIRTNIPNLTVLPPGADSKAMTELVSSKRMRRLVEEIANRYHDRLVIFDTSPLLQESSSHVLAALMGQILLVVEAEKTPQHIVKEALRIISGCDASVGFVLNKSNQRFAADSGYGYY